MSKRRKEGEFTKDMYTAQEENNNAVFDVDDRGDHPNSSSSTHTIRGFQRATPEALRDRKLIRISGTGDGRINNNSNTSLPPPSNNKNSNSIQMMDPLQPQSANTKMSSTSSSSTSPFANVNLIPTSTTGGLGSSTFQWGSSTTSGQQPAPAAPSSFAFKTSSSSAAFGGGGGGGTSTSTTSSSEKQQTIVPAASAFLFGKNAESVDNSLSQQQQQQQPRNPLASSSKKNKYDHSTTSRSTTNTTAVLSNLCESFRDHIQQFQSIGHIENLHYSILTFQCWVRDEMKSNPMNPLLDTTNNTTNSAVTTTTTAAPALFAPPSAAAPAAAGGGGVAPSVTVTQPSTTFGSFSFAPSSNRLTTTTSTTTTTGSNSLWGGVQTYANTTTITNNNNNNKENDNDDNPVEDDNDPYNAILSTTDKEWDDIYDCPSVKFYKNYQKKDEKERKNHLLVEGKIRIQTSKTNKDQYRMVMRDTAGLRILVNMLIRKDTTFKYSGKQSKHGGPMKGMISFSGNNHHDGYGIFGIVTPTSQIGTELTNLLIELVKKSSS